jgi:glycine cleavage system regulatory protein
LYACKQGLELELLGEERLGIVGKLTKMLAERGIGIESIHTGIVRSGVPSTQTFRDEAGYCVGEEAICCHMNPCD